MITEFTDPNMIAEQEPIIQCLICSFSGNEMRFIKQAEREPRSDSGTMAPY
ncbi:hypothetical protein ABE504_32305 [Paenibacillus oryzisoli]|uniref:hypothetical protein n=1 Tax=Paenibacillus oryzisoli TaxID=1850517 RepID=UPI003D2E0ABF